jgi:peptidase, M22 family
MVGGKAYATVGYEQGRFEALVHFDGAQVHGGSVMYNIVEW